MKSMCTLLRIGLGLLMLFPLLPTAIAQTKCEQKVTSPAYSVCFPKSWRVYGPDSSDRISGCNKRDGKCTGDGGGFPLAGVVFVFVAPAENTPGLASPPNSVEDIVRASKTKLGALTIDDVVDVVIDSSDGVPRKARVARALWNPGKVWDEVYGVEVQSKLFRAWVQYIDERDRTAVYRAEVARILSSIKLADKQK